MRLPRPKITVCRMMVAVAILAGCFALAERTIRFRRLANYHWLRAEPDIGCCGPLFTEEGEATILVESVSGKPITQARASWHATLCWKYEYAARYPWLPIETDPARP